MGFVDFGYGFRDLLWLWQWVVVVAVMVGCHAGGCGGRW